MATVATRAGGLIGECECRHSLHARSLVAWQGSIRSRALENGLAKYDGDGGRVAQRFLMPVMVGSFDHMVARTNDEQPLSVWIEALRATGFAEVTIMELYRYRLAPAYLIGAW